MVDDEAGAVRGTHRLVAEGRHQGAQSLGDAGAGGETVDHLHQTHQRHRIEEVQTGDPAGIATGRGDRGNRQRGGIAGEDRFVADHLFNWRNNACLASRFSTIASITNWQPRRTRKSSTTRRLPIARAADSASSRPRSTCRARTVAICSRACSAAPAVVEQHRQAGTGSEPGDALAHGAGTDDADENDRWLAHFPRYSAVRFPGRPACPPSGRGCRTATGRPRSSARAWSSGRSAPAGPLP